MDLSSLHQAIYDQAESFLRELSHGFGIPKTRQHLAFGRIDTEIRRIADEKDIDVIVVGSHGRHGIGHPIWIDTQRSTAKSNLRCPGGACRRLVRLLFSVLS